jgi:hypothetical protein
MPEHCYACSPRCIMYTSRVPCASGCQYHDFRGELARNAKRFNGIATKVFVERFPLQQTQKDNCIEYVSCLVDYGGAYKIACESWRQG